MTNVDLPDELLTQFRIGPPDQHGAARPPYAKPSRKRPRFRPGIPSILYNPWQRL